MPCQSNVVSLLHQAFCLASAHSIDLSQKYIERVVKNGRDYTSHSCLCRRADQYLGIPYATYPKARSILLYLHCVFLGRTNPSSHGPDFVYPVKRELQSKVVGKANCQRCRTAVKLYSWASYTSKHCIPYGHYDNHGSTGIASVCETCPSVTNRHGFTSIYRESSSEPGQCQPVETTSNQLSRKHL